MTRKDKLYWSILVKWKDPSDWELWDDFIHFVLELLVSSIIYWWRLEWIHEYVAF